MKSSSLCLILAALVFGPVAQAESPPVLNFTKAVGVNIHDLKPGDLARIKAAGFTWVRLDVNWMSVEKKPGVYNFSGFDGLMAQLAANKLRALVVIGYGNPLYAEEGDTWPYTSRGGTAEFRRAYADFCSALVEHSAGKGALWELWNEANEHTWRGDIKDYLALIKQTASAIHEKSRDEMIVGPASSYIDLKFIEACLKVGMLDYWSAITVHPYRRTPPESVSRDYEALRTLIAKYTTNGAPIPIICGEWGYSTAWGGISEATQANYLARMIAVNRKENIPLTIIYDWRDDGDDSSNPEYRFGLVRRNFEGRFVPKSALTEIKTAIGPGLTPSSGALKPTSGAHN